MAQAGFRKEIAVGKSGNQVSERGRGINNAVKAGGIFDTQPAEVMQGLVGIGNRRQQDLDTGRDGFGEAARHVLQLGAGTMRVAKIDLFSEARHGGNTAQIGLQRYNQR